MLDMQTSMHVPFAEFNVNQKKFLTFIFDKKDNFCYFYEIKV